jgi:uncharacterized membrane protein (GlpM family)
MTPRKALALGTIVVGTLDILDALVFFGLRGVQPIRIFQSIAAGLLGRESFGGGLATALLGGLLHYFIAFGIVGVYFVASRRAPALTRHAVVLGMLYGVVVYFVMNYVVIPLSAASGGQFSLPVFVNGILIHIFGVGLPAALFARAAARPEAG